MRLDGSHATHSMWRNTLANASAASLSGSVSAPTPSPATPMHRSPAPSHARRRRHDSSTSRPENRLNTDCTTIKLKPRTIQLPITTTRTARRPPAPPTQEDGDEKRPLETAKSRPSTPNAKSAHETSPCRTSRPGTAARSVVCSIVPRRLERHSAASTAAAAAKTTTTPSK